MPKRYIDVNTWLHGEGAQASMLYRETDCKQCCLGQWAIAAGIPIENIREEVAPCVLLENSLVEANVAIEYFDAFTTDNDQWEESDEDENKYLNSEYATKLIQCNDRQTDEHGQPMTLAMRIQEMVQIGNEYGDEIIFLNVPEDQLSW